MHLGGPALKERDRRILEEVREIDEILDALPKDDDPQSMVGMHRINLLERRARVLSWLSTSSEEEGVA